jgi:ERCC4-type nuclease
VGFRDEDLKTLTAKDKRYIEGCVILVDTREQTPLEFENHEIRREGLTCGDYSIVGPDGTSFKPGNPGAVAVERKSLGDLAGSVTTGRDRFEREFERARELDHFALVIECSLSDIVDKFYRSKVTPQSVIQTLVSWAVRYDTPVWFADNHRFAGRLTESILEKHVRHLLIERAVEVNLEAA